MKDFNEFSKINEEANPILGDELKVSKGYNQFVENMTQAIELFLDSVDEDGISFDTDNINDFDALRSFVNDTADSAFKMTNLESPERFNDGIQEGPADFQSVDFEEIENTD